MTPRLRQRSGAYLLLRRRQGPVRATVGSNFQLCRVLPEEDFRSASIASFGYAVTVGHFFNVIHVHTVIAVMPDDKNDDILRQLLQQSQQATQDLIAALPQMLATALAGAPAGAVGGAGPGAAGADGNAALLRPARDLRDRKVPGFWDESPKAWFKIFDDHLANADPPLADGPKFSLLLPLLKGKAIKLVSRLVESPPANAYTAAKELLLLHFGRSSEEMIAELHGLSSLGDRTAVDFLEYMQSLQPGEPETKLFKHIFVHALPPQVRSIVADKPTLSAMAAAADVILLTVPQEAVVSSVNAVSSGAAPKVFIPQDQLTDGLCFIHHCHGRNAYN